MEMIMAPSEMPHPVLGKMPAQALGWGRWGGGSSAVTSQVWLLGFMDRHESRGTKMQKVNYVDCSTDRSEILA